MPKKAKTPAYIIREANEADLPALVDFLAKLALHVSGGPAMALKDSEHDRLMRALRSTLASARKLIVVAEQPGVGLVGMGDISILSSPSIWEQAAETEHRSGVIDDVWVEPDYRNAGIFKALLRKLVEFADSQGAQELILEYSTSNKEAKTAWSRLGFVTTGVRAAAFTEQVKEALI